MCLTLCDPLDTPGSSVHEILQAKMLAWITFPSPGGLSDPVIELALQADLYFLSHQGRGDKEIENAIKQGMGM